MVAEKRWSSLRQRTCRVIEYAHKNDVTPLFSSKQFADPWIRHDTVR